MPERTRVGGSEGGSRSPGGGRGKRLPGRRVRPFAAPPSPPGHCAPAGFSGRIPAPTPDGGGRRSGSWRPSAGVGRDGGRRWGDALGAEPRERRAAGRGQVSSRSAPPPPSPGGAPRDPAVGSLLPSPSTGGPLDCCADPPSPQSSLPRPEQPEVLPGCAKLPRGCKRGSASQAPERTRSGRGECLAETGSLQVFSAESIFCYKTVRKVITRFCLEPIPFYTPAPQP